MAGKIKYLHVDTNKLKKPSMKIDGFFVGTTGLLSVIQK
jgi:hypothetical protein